MEQVLGRVTAVAGSQMMVSIDSEQDGAPWTRIGALVKVMNNGSQVVGTVATVEMDRNAEQGRALVVDLLGEITSSNGRASFSRGVSHYPTAGSKVVAAAEPDIQAVYAQPQVPSIRIGTYYDDETRPAYVLTDELMGKHFAVLGTTGSGKSCAVTLILSAILGNHPNAHVVLLDPHNEYSTAFGDLAEIVNVDNLRLPLWLLDLEEAVRTLIRGGSVHEQEAQAIILKDAITWARRHRAGQDPKSSSITVDTPVPFRIFDLLRFINEEMGRLGKPDTAIPYLRLRTRIESLRDDRRFNFMFADSADDTLSDIIGRLLRIPVRGKPITIVDLSGVPSEVTDVVVSLMCRVVFDFAIWSDRTRMPPILLVCEEAQRYIPADERVGFAATARAISRIAKEGRKYGLSLALVTQRPSEISSHALSQCGTVFALRLGDDLDQRFIAKTLPDAARGMLAALPSLPTREAVISGEGVRLPTRIRFDYLPMERQPRSLGAKFSLAWQTDNADADFRDDTIRRWRTQSRSN
jgi:DNA helicase HerA-like ATPase